MISYHICITFKYMNRNSYDISMAANYPNVL